MKYWKQFWGGLNQGYKRMHYVLVPSISFLITITLNSKIRGNVMKWLDEAIMISILQSLGYVIVVSLIYWIKEGFQSKEPTEDE